VYEWIDISFCLQDVKVPALFGAKLWLLSYADIVVDWMFTVHNISLHRMGKVLPRLHGVFQRWKSQ